MQPSVAGGFSFSLYDWRGLWYSENDVLYHIQP